MDPALVSLIAACIAFVGSHFALSHPLRAPLVRALGERPFLGLYTLVAFLTLGWIVLAFRAAPADIGGAPGPAGDVLWAAASLLTIVALVLLFGSFRGNPAVPETPAEKVAAAAPRGIFAVTRHPMMWAFALWAIAHMLIFWSTRTMIVAAAILLLALLGAHLQDRKKRALQGEAWAHWEAQTSYWPRWSGLLSAGWGLWLAAILLWLAITWLHLWLAGLPAGIWRWAG